MNTEDYRKRRVRSCQVGLPSFDLHSSAHLETSPISLFGFVSCAEARRDRCAPLRKRRLEVHLTSAAASLLEVVWSFVPLLLLAKSIKPLVSNKAAVQA